MCPQLGLVVPPHALSLPFESVKELGDYWCEVTVRNVHYQCITFIVILSLFASFFFSHIYVFLEDAPATHKKWRNILRVTLNLLLKWRAPLQLSLIHQTTI